MMISVFGFGNVGKKIAALMSDANQQVTIATRLGDEQDLPFPVLSFEQAAIEADVVIIALPFSVVESVFSPIAAHLEGKIIIDATNPLKEDWSPLLLGQENSAGEQLQQLLKGAKVAKAFNTIFADVMGSEEREAFGQPLTAFIASDHSDAKEWLRNILSAVGFTPVDTGPMTSARYLEAMAHLNIQIAVNQGGGTSAAFLYQQT